MKKLLLISVMILVCVSAVSSFASGKRSLPQSSRKSSELFVYKLDEKDVRDLYLKKKNLEESMLHTFVPSCPEVRDIPALPRGNYIWVRAVDERLVYSDHTVDDFSYRVVEDESAMLFISDTLGNAIEKAVVKCGAKRLRFDKETRTYGRPRIKAGRTVEVNNGGVLHYIKFDEKSVYKPRRKLSFKSVAQKTKKKVKNIFRQDKAKARRTYNGFMVFSKPKYKPGETVKFKAYVNDDGKPCDRELDVALVSYAYRGKMDTVLTTLKPYRSGMYEWQFRLSDSLKMRLDNAYSVVLRGRGKNPESISGVFRYENYELGRITFDAVMDNRSYARGDTVRIRVSARDENGMPIYDGRVDVQVKPSRYGTVKYYDDNVFIPYETWSHTFDMTGKASDVLVLPDSAFVGNTAMNYDIRCSFLDAGNEKHEENLSVYMDTRGRMIRFVEGNGTLTVREMDRGRSVAARALLRAYDRERGTEVYCDSVMLPYTFPLMWMASDYEVRTATSCGSFNIDDMKGGILGHRFFVDNGNVRLKVDNPAGVPFWYTVRRGNSIIDRGYVRELDRSYKDHGKKGYAMQISYLLGDEARSIRDELPYVQKSIYMDVNTPVTVYPGHSSKVRVSVRDNKGRPVRGADITAYAFTSKFGSYAPGVSVSAKVVNGKRFGNGHYSAADVAPGNSWVDMDWDVWRGRMGLDSMEYYKFLYPEVFYSYSEKAEGEVTQIVPYVVIDGKLQGVHILYIDNEPHYFHQAGQMDVYSFPVAPGVHTLKFRTSDREIEVRRVYAEKGMKTIFSFNGKQSVVCRNAFPGKWATSLEITVNEFRKEGRGELTASERAMLRKHMITVDDTFGAMILPDSRSVGLPAMINAGGVWYLLNDPLKPVDKRRFYPSRDKPVLAGPFPYRGFYSGGKNVGSLYVDTMFVSTFGLEGGYRYGIWQNYIKQTGWGSLPFSSEIKPFTPVASFTRNALNTGEVRERFRKAVLDRISGRSGLVTTTMRGRAPGCLLKMDIGGADGKKEPRSPLAIRLYGKGMNDTVECLYYGKTRVFSGMPAGDYQVDLVFGDTTRCSVPVTLRKGGTNYLRVDTAEPVAADSIGRRIFGLLDSQMYIYDQSRRLSDYAMYAGKDSIVVVPPEVAGSFDSVNYRNSVITGVVREVDGTPVVGALVKVEGAEKGTVTDAHGRFSLPDPGEGDLEVFSVGYKPFFTRVVRGYDYRIILESLVNDLDEVVVVGYGVMRRSDIGGAVPRVSFDYAEATAVNSLEGRFAGMQSVNDISALMGGTKSILVRGAGSFNSSTEPLIVVNGVPYDGAMSDLDPKNILSMNILKDGKATYGARGANGVVLIVTKDGMAPTPSGWDGVFPEGWDKANALRTDFRDDAFWHPALSTGKDGTVTFDVTYPDDITSWTAHFIAVSGRKQVDKARLNIRSFKPINAQLSLPQFAIVGDSLNAVGRLTNHMGDTVDVKRSVELQGRVSAENMSLVQSHVDTIPVVADDADSISVTYSLSMENGYFDGERRTIPLYRPGVLETHGQFAVLDERGHRRFTTDPALGKVTVHAEASAVQMFLDEIEGVIRYPYMCNEQMASKVKALLVKKRLYAMSGRKFKEDGKINDLLGQLVKNKNRAGLWGWWNREISEMWISAHVVDALLAASAEGYKVDFDRRAAAARLTSGLNLRLSKIDVRDPRVRFAKRDLLGMLELLVKLDADIDYGRYFTLISSLPNATLNDRLRCMEIEADLGTVAAAEVDSLLGHASKTIPGSMYWCEKKRRGAHPMRSLLPNASDTENTLAAYRILRKIGGHEKELGRIRSYFFEMRKDGSWRNTYESSRIIETIMPDMVGPEGVAAPVELTVNGRRFEKFPLTVEMEAGETVDIFKEGAEPVFFTVYQQSWNERPEKKTEGFSVKTSFRNGDGPVMALKAGKSVDLKVNVVAESYARYVMIEVPIPAGCSFESKGGSYSGNEIHREHHKEKVVIFCSRLSKGSHEFTVKLLPRYTGVFHLNPAKAELMYYPTFFGRTGAEICRIK